MNIIRKIFGTFEDTGIRYCHFKSNQHLDISFKGKSDFDILIDYRKKSESDRILLDYNCKKFEAFYFKQYPNVENWLAFDPETGCIYHLHIHFQIITGKSFVKDYMLPWGEQILNTALNHPTYGIKISDPNWEIITLLSRIVVKSNINEIIKSYLGLYSMNKNTRDEYGYLVERCNREIIVSNARLYFSEKTAYFMASLSERDTINSTEFRKLSHKVRKELALYRRLSPLEASFLSMRMHAKSFFNRVKRKSGSKTTTKKITTSGGRIIAFVGVDGSGKSTLSEETAKWLKSKIEAKRVYMGAGVGTRRLMAKIISKKENRISNSKTPSAISISQNSDKKLRFIDAPVTYLKKYFRALAAYKVEKINCKTIRQLLKYRINGGYAILDRFPQLQHEGANDGLKVVRYNEMLKSSYISKLTLKEAQMMNIFQTVQPDILFKLNISAQTSMKRKPEQKNIQFFQNKIDILNWIEFPKSIVINIDGECLLEEVLLEVKRQIWNQI